MAVSRRLQAAGISHTLHHFRAHHHFLCSRGEPPRYTKRNRPDLCAGVHSQLNCPSRVRTVYMPKPDCTRRSAAAIWTIGWRRPAASTAAAWGLSPMKNSCASSKENFAARTRCVRRRDGACAGSAASVAVDRSPSEENLMWSQGCWGQLCSRPHEIPTPSPLPP